MEPEREGAFVVTAHDLCLAPLDVATAQVLVSDVHRIVVTVVDKVWNFYTPFVAISPTYKNVSDSDLG